VRHKVAWPCDQFLAALKIKPGEDWEIESRRQVFDLIRKKYEKEA